LPLAPRPIPLFRVVRIEKWTPSKAPAQAG
jgi:hypothetical protein